MAGIFDPSTPIKDAATLGTRDPENIGFYGVDNEEVSDDQKGGRVSLLEMQRLLDNQYFTVDLSKPGTYPAGTTVLSGSSATENGAELNALYAALDPTRDKVVFPRGFFVRTNETIYPRGVETEGPCKANLVPTIAADNAIIGGIVSAIPKSATTVTGTDFVFDGDDTITTTTTDLSVFSVGQMLVFENNTDPDPEKNHGFVCTITSVAANQITTAETRFEEANRAYTSSDSFTVTVLTPLVEDGLGIQGRTSFEFGNVFTGMGLLSADAVSGTPLLNGYSNYSFVIGYKGGRYGDNTNERMTNSCVKVRAHSLAVGVSVSGWYNNVSTLARNCLVGSAISHNNGGEIKSISQQCGTDRFFNLTGAKLFTRDEVADAQRIAPTFFGTMYGTEIQCRSEAAGGNSSLRRIALDLFQGSKIHMLLGGQSNPLATDAVYVRRSNGSQFTGYLTGVADGGNSHCRFETNCAPSCKYNFNDSATVFDNGGLSATPL